MMDLFSDEVRRDPYPVYAHMRRCSPTLYVPPPFDGWLIFDYAGVKQALSDHQTFSSRVPAPRHWFIFFDPPAHSKLRALISSAFTPRMIATIELSIRRLSRHLLDDLLASEEIEADVAAEFSTPLPMKVIAAMIGIPDQDWPRFKRWSDGILKLSYARSGGEEAQQAGQVFTAVTEEMTPYLDEMTARRRAEPQEDLLTRLVEAEIDGQRLAPEEILGFVQLLIIGGQETTTNLIDNALICFLENRAQCDLLKAQADLLPSAIEETLRYRSPLQWMMRTPRRDVELNGCVIPAGKLVLPMIGAANRDPKQFANPHQFDITRHPNLHVAFGHGIHSCLGAALARMEARIALSDLFARTRNFEFAGSAAWQPRKALHVHGPDKLQLRFVRSA